jgi:hypothetical protein
MKYIDDLICILFAAIMGALFALVWIFKTGGF